MSFFLYEANEVHHLQQVLNCINFNLLSCIILFLKVHITYERSMSNCQVPQSQAQS
ncbi:unnamed protein product [Amoebophrya sp. A25]|nr:unnamed protein product [Amoebophrya sp. A25]|eukprot:GSA25T00000603001.1